MRFIPLQSSNLAGLAYDANQEELVAQFTNGAWYKYRGVPGDVVLAVLFDPDSQGKSFNAKVVKGAYPYEQMSSEAVDIHV